MLIPIGLLIAFLLILLLRNPCTRGCRFRADRRRDGPQGAFYHCTACGNSGFTSVGKAPKTCFKRENQRCDDDTSP